MGNHKLGKSSNNADSRVSRTTIHMKGAISVFHTLLVCFARAHKAQQSIIQNAKQINVRINDHIGTRKKVPFQNKKTKHNMFRFLAPM